METMTTEHIILHFLTSVGSYQRYLWSFVININCMNQYGDDTGGQNIGVRI